MHALLRDLRDIHVPPPVATWPPAVGWWIILLFVMVGMAYISYQFYHAYRAHRLRQALVRAWHQQLAQSDHPSAAASLFLRRVALRLAPRATVAGLVGPAWITFLNRCSRAPLSSPALQQALLQVPYQRSVDLAHDDVRQAVEAWLRGLASAALLGKTSS